MRGREIGGGWCKYKRLFFRRGFGFVKFLEPKSVQAALAAKPHVIDNKIVSILWSGCGR